MKKFEGICKISNKSLEMIDVISNMLRKQKKNDVSCIFMFEN